MKITAEHIKAAIAAVESGDPEAMKAVLTDILAALADGEEAGEPAEPTEENAEEPGEEEEPEVQNAKPDDPERNSAAVIRSLQGKVNSLLAEKEARELVERRSLTAQLVKLGVETPATAWSGKPEKQIPAKRLLDEPLEEFRSRVAQMAEVRGKDITHAPPARDLPDVSTLSQRELDACKKRGMDPAEYIRRKAGAVRTVQPKAAAS